MDIQAFYFAWGFVAGTAFFYVLRDVSQIRAREDCTPSKSVAVHKVHLLEGSVQDETRRAGDRPGRYRRAV